MGTTYLPAKLTTIRDDLGVAKALLPSQPPGPLYWAEAEIPGPGRRRAAGASITNPRQALDMLIDKVRAAGHEGITVAGPDGQTVYIS